MGKCSVAARFGGHHDGKFIAVSRSPLCGGDELFRFGVARFLVDYGGNRRQYVSGDVGNGQNPRMATEILR